MVTASMRSMALSVRYLFSGNPLVRSHDRWEGALVLFVALLAWLVVPIAAAVGTEVYTTGAAEARAEAGTRHLVEATLVRDAGTKVDGVQWRTKMPASARWHTPDGRLHFGEPEVPIGLRSGETTEIWVDSDGAPAAAPHAPGEVLAQGVGAGFALLVAAVGALALLLRFGRKLIDRARWEVWAREWTAVAPAWDGRYR